MDNLPTTRVSRRDWKAGPFLMPSAAKLAVSSEAGSGRTGPTYSILNNVVAGNKTEEEPLMEFAHGEIHQRSIDRP